MVNEGRFNYGKDHDKVKLDKRDKYILTLLAKDARMPITQIAKKVKLSRDAVNYRINRLVKENIIIRFFPNISYEKLGLYIFHVFFLVEEKNPQKKKEFLEFLKKNDHIFSIIEYTDKWDFEISLVAKNLIEFDKIILDICSNFPDIILEKNKLELIRRFNNSHVPPLLHQTAKQEIQKKHERDEIIKIDRTDYEILELLSDDCRKSTYDIGKKIGISADTVSYRIKNLLKNGIIKNFTISINLSKLKFQWYTYTMEMKMFDYKNEMKLEEFLYQNKNIVRSAKTLGGWDLLMYFAVEDARGFHSIVKEIKNTFSDVVKNYSTWVAYREHLFDPMPDAIAKIVKK